MAHLDLLLQKGDIGGPPYVMPDHLELSFMRGFVERQRNGTAHNPRLRGLPADEQHRIPIDELDDEEVRASPESLSVASPLKSPEAGTSSSSRLAPPGPPSSSQADSPTAWVSLNPMELSQRIDAARTCPMLP